MLRSNLQLRALGFDDAPFSTNPRIFGSVVNVVGIATSNSKFEGMLYGSIKQDFLDSTDVLISMIKRSKFLPQIHAVLIDGLTLGGLNVVDLQKVATEVDRVCVAVMRRQPNIEKMLNAMRNLPHFEERSSLLTKAGPIHVVQNWTFQYRVPNPHDYTTPEDVAKLLQLLTPTGTQKIPECLRIAHLIGAAIKTGESGSSA